jgi:hypothetical protein
MANIPEKMRKIIGKEEEFLDFRSKLPYYDIKRECSGSRLKNRNNIRSY